ncbi:N-acetylmuramoyl-L-alanine amidase family protein [Clostridium botulinum]|nr:N-acetylmuramoyl-L-alanine amidase family protein [Clostridium botulinum]
MIKRISKLTGLVIMATTIVSILPTTYANAAVKLQTLDGNMDSVQAFDGGKYLFNGYKEENPDNEIYFFDGTKDKEIKSLNGNFEKYGNNFVNFINNDKLFNLKTGNIEEDNIEDKKLYLELNFKKSVINKVDRYSDTKNLVYANTVTKDNFDELWFEYKLQNDDGSKSFNLFISESGKYIDTSENLNIVHYSKDGTKIKLNTFEDLESNGYTVKFENALFQDNNYIYRLATITNKTDSTDTTTYMQKISKSQGELKNGAYLPKEVSSYSLGSTTASEITPNKSENFSVNIINNSIQTVKVTNNEMTILKYDFVREKDNSENSVTSDRISMIKKDEDYKSFKNQKITSYDIDKNGTVWILYKGNIQRVVNDTLETMYAVDRDMNKISVYDENDIVVWNSDENIYSTVGGTTLRIGWVQYADGTWSYLKEDTSKSTGWVKDSNKWYYLDSNGVMQTGWLLDGGKWYYLTASGAMQTGWLFDNGSWYYLNQSGAMENDGWLKVDNTWYYLNSNGSLKTNSWLLDKNLWYYLDSSGAMVTNTVIDGYKIGAKGFWVK